MRWVPEEMAMNTPVNDETLIAYLDAELDAADMDAVEQAPAQGGACKPW
jgi:anti-sigma factor RsiW